MARETKTKAPRKTTTATKAKTTRSRINLNKVLPSSEQAALGTDKGTASEDVDDMVVDSDADLNKDVPAKSDSDSVCAEESVHEHLGQ
jgi:hypothetical protein